MSAGEPDFLVRAFPEVAVGGFTRIDGTVHFYTRVNALVDASTVVLDFGAGRGAGAEDRVPFRRSLRNLRGKAAKVIGADVDPAVSVNPTLDEHLLIDRDGRIPLDDATIDVVVTDYVFEHIKDPQLCASELTRVLRPGGWLCVRTPTRFHYVAVLNRIVQSRARDRILSALQSNRKRKDTFDAFYRLNTKRDLRRYFPGYRHVVFFWDAEPRYHGGSAGLFFAMNALRAVTPPPLRANIFAFLQKRGA